MWIYQDDIFCNLYHSLLITHLAYSKITRGAVGRGTQPKKQKPHEAHDIKFTPGNWFPNTEELSGQKTSLRQLTYRSSSCCYLEKMLESPGPGSSEQECHSMANRSTALLLLILQRTGQRLAQRSPQETDYQNHHCCWLRLLLGWHWEEQQENKSRKPPHHACLCI